MKKKYLLFLGIPIILSCTPNSKSGEIRDSKIDSCAFEAQNKLPNTNIQFNNSSDTTSTKDEFIERQTDISYDKKDLDNNENLEYKVVKLEQKGRFTIKEQLILKYIGIIRISNDYSSSQLYSIADEVLFAHPEIPKNAILFFEFYKNEDALDGLNYGLVKRIDGVWEHELNEAYLLEKKREKQYKENKKKYGNSWVTRSKEIANGDKILGVFEYSSDTYEMILQQGKKYYLVEFKMNSSDISKDELVKVGKNRFRYNDRKYDDLLVIERNQLVTYMPDIFEPGKLAISETWAKAK